VQLPDQGEELRLVEELSVLNEVLVRGKLSRRTGDYSITSVHLYGGFGSDSGLSMLYNAK